MRVLTAISSLCLLACTGNPQHAGTQEVKNAENTPKPALTVADTPTPAVRGRSGIIDRATYRLRAEKTLANDHIFLWTSQGANQLVIENRLTHKTDTLALQGIPEMGDRPPEIKDLTQSVALSRLTLCITWEGDSDNDYSEVVGYQQDTLKELFEIPAAGGLVDLKRKNAQMLTGHAWGEDDVVRSAHDNYIVTVSLPGYDVHITPPDILKIDQDIEVKDTVHAFRVSASGILTPYILLPDTRIHVDTIYFRQQLVSLHLNDSGRLTVPHDSIAWKLKVSTAG